MKGDHGAVEVLNRGCVDRVKLKGFEILIVLCLIGFSPEFAKGLSGMVGATGVVKNVLN